MKDKKFTNKKLQLRINNSVCLLCYQKDLKNLINQNNTLKKYNLKRRRRRKRRKKESKKRKQKKPLYLSQNGCCQNKNSIQNNIEHIEIKQIYLMEEVLTKAINLKMILRSKLWKTFE